MDSSGSIQRWTSGASSAQNSKMTLINIKESSSGPPGDHYKHAPREHREQTYAGAGGMTAVSATTDYDTIAERYAASIG